MLRGSGFILAGVFSASQFKKKKNRLIVSCYRVEKYKAVPSLGWLREK